MIEDIIPPRKKESRPHPSIRTMPSARLQAQSQQAAKSRINDPGPLISTTEVPGGAFSDVDGNQTSQPETDKRKPPWLRSRWHKLALVLVTLLVVSGGVSAYLFSRPSNQSSGQAIVAKTPPPEPPKPKTEPSPLTGNQVAPELAKRPVTGIMIENSPDARPQSGLRDAGVIYEAIAEGGVTRFLALYQESTPGYIGPVRSLRPYYLDWLAPYDASVAHVGGSLDALEQVRSGMKDLDQFFNGSSFTRISERYAPHNVYTSFAKLDNLNQSKGYTSSKFIPYERKKDNPFAKPIARKINIRISGAYYNAAYSYDGVSNTYFRNQAGAAHTDVTSQDDGSPYQLRPKVVIAMAANYSYGAANDGYRSSYTTTGGGKAWIFQDGNMIEGRWEKTNRTSQLVFKDNAGQIIKFNPGQMWISLVSTNDSVSIEP